MNIITFFLSTAGTNTKRLGQICARFVAENFYSG